MGSPILVWFRRDLRLSDHPALSAAAATGRPVIPVFLFDEEFATLGAAAQWRMKKAVRALGRDLETFGSRLILRTGPAEVALEQVIQETGATEVWYSRSYRPDLADRDRSLTVALAARGQKAVAFPGTLLFDPATVKTGQGGAFKVYTPFWNAVRHRPVGPALPKPLALPAPDLWPESEALSDWNIGKNLYAGRLALRRHCQAGEVAAQAKLADFVSTRIADYKARRDFLDVNATSNLSDHLTVGEISVRQCWQAGWRALQQGAAGAEHFLKELVWREFAWHLLHHTPHIATRAWRKEWQLFPWKTDENSAEVQAWKRGQTGVDLVDAAMRELYVTGRMHNRARMIVASYLTKHLLVDWRIGLRWFEDHLTDWDPASNALGWQWVAGCGPDAAPYFRVFNPDGQAEKFDPDQIYRRRWLDPIHSPDAAAFYRAVPKSWGLSPDDPRPDPVIGLAEGRKAALAAYDAYRALQS